MPQATEELRNEIRRRFGDIDSGAVVAWLQARGYKLRVDFHWDAPKPSRTPSPDEYSALAFLADEWDFGWIVEEEIRDGSLRTCPSCAAPLTLARPYQIYCSVRCQQRAHAKRKAAREKARRQ